LNLRYIDWIWHIRGEVPLTHPLTAITALDRLDALFQEPGTDYTRSGETIVFRKKNQAAQDKMSTFDRGVVEVVSDGSGTRLTYDLMSKTLLMCFLLPFLFFACGQFFHYTARHDGAKPHILAQSASNRKGVAAHNFERKNDTTQPMNSIDRFLRAPAPEKKDLSKEESNGKKKISPTPAYVFASIFAFLYLVGRVLEHVLINNIFRKRIYSEVAPDAIKDIVFV